MSSAIRHQEVWDWSESAVPTSACPLQWQTTHRTPCPYLRNKRFEWLSLLYTYGRTNDNPASSQQPAELASVLRYWVVVVVVASISDTTDDTGPEGQELEGRKQIQYKYRCNLNTQQVIPCEELIQKKDLTRQPYTNGLLCLYYPSCLHVIWTFLVTVTT